MPDAVTVAIAKAVESYIDSSVSIAAPYVLGRSYAEWDLDLKSGEFEIDDAERLHIDVVSHSTDTGNQLSARGKLQFDCTIDIAVRQKLTQAEQQIESGRLNPEEIDALMAVVQLLHVSLTAQRLPDFDCATWQSTQVVIAPDISHLRLLRQFTAIIRLVFRADIKIPIQE